MPSKLPVHAFIQLFVLVFVGVGFNVMKINSITSSKSAATQAPTARPRQKIILLGPHDRFNFGDLLFEKIVSKLLVTRKHYQESDLIRAGMINVNMSRYGGCPNIISAKRARDLSRNAPVPYHIIYTGGESLGCSMERGLTMLPNNKSRVYAANHSVGDCAYLFSKEQLSLDYNKNSSVAVVNSVGGAYNPHRQPQDCRRAIDTADYVAFRDLEPGSTHFHVPHAVARPDSAVMMDLLFGNVISDYGQQGEVATVREMGGYLVVQFKETPQYWHAAEQIGRVLDNIFNHTNLTTVFFRAGSVPKHDSLGLYQRVASQMKSPSYIFTTEHVFAVVALIRYASAVISTSLHVRIMAFVHARPRVTLCLPKNSKHSRFINIWESKDATSCVERFGKDVWPTLESSLRASPNATYVAQQRAMDTYLQGFEEWSSLFDGKDDINKTGTSDGTPLHHNNTENNEKDKKDKTNMAGEGRKTTTRRMT